MTIKKVMNEATGEEIVIAVGKIDQISVKEMDAPDRFQNTHRASIRIGEDWINNITIKVKEDKPAEVRVNNGTQGRPDWQSVEVGDEVRMTLSPWTREDGTTAYSSGVSKIKITKKGESVPVKATANGTVREAYKPRDTSGMETGHALNGALNLIRDNEDEYNVENIAKLASTVHAVTDKLKKEYASKNPEMSEYDLGAMVGNAVLNATRDAEEAGIEEHARFLLDEVVPKVAQLVKAGKEEKAADAKSAKKPAGKSTKPKVEAKPKPVEKEEIVDTTPNSNLAGLDDDIPF